VIFRQPREKSGPPTAANQPSPPPFATPSPLITIPPTGTRTLQWRPVRRGSREHPGRIPRGSPISTRSLGHSRGWRCCVLAKRSIPPHVGEVGIGSEGSGFEGRAGIEMPGFQRMAMKTPEPAIDSGRARGFRAVRRDGSSKSHPPPSNHTSQSASHPSPADTNSTHAMRVWPTGVGHGPDPTAPVEFVSSRSGPRFGGKFDTPAALLARYRRTWTGFGSLCRVSD
jgi:hypothetical protein